MRTRKNCIECGWTDNWKGNCPKCGFFGYRRIYKSKDGHWYQSYKKQKLLLDIPYSDLVIGKK